MPIFMRLGKMGLARLLKILFLTMADTTQNLDAHSRWIEATLVQPEM